MRIPTRWSGTDSHTTMINGLGVLGWGVGGIEAEAAMLGQAVSMLVPQVVGYKLTGKLREGATATDLVLTVTQALRKLGVVGKFVEFYGPGNRGAAAGRSRHHQQHGARVRRDLRHLPGGRGDAALSALTGRSEEQIALVEAYYKEQGLFHTDKLAGSRVHADARAGSGDCGAERGRTEASAGSRAAEGRGGELCAATADPACAHGQAAWNAHRSCLGTDRSERHRSGHCGGGERRPPRHLPLPTRIG